MKITVRIDVPESVREALKRHMETTSLPDRSAVTKWFLGVCHAATFSIVDQNDLTKANKKRGKKVVPSPADK